MTHEEILEIAERLHVLRKGHFMLTSGRHSDRFLLCSQLTMHPSETAKLIGALAEKVRAAGIQPNLVIGPAMGGVILAYEMARALGCRAMFTEKDGEAMALKRGFALSAADKVLVVEDAVSTGGSIQKVLDVVRLSEAELVGVAMLFDRTMGKIGFDGAPTISLMQLKIDSWSSEECPFCKQGVPLVLPKA